MKMIRYALAFLICIIAPFIKATIPAEQTRGLYDAIIDGYKHLSPTHGFVAHEQKTFDGYYHYTQPSEPLYKLMHILFRFVDNLIPHVSDSAVGTNLDAPMIGKLLAVIEKNLDRSTGIIQIPKDELKKRLLEILNETGTRMKQKTKVGPRETFAQVLVDALDETGHWDPKGKHYPQFIVHDMLLTLLFKKVNSKPEYKNYFDQFNKLNDGKGILKTNADELLNKIYEDPNDPATMAKNILAAQPTGEAYTMFDYILDHYDAVAYANIKLGRSVFGYPPQVSFGKVLLSWYQKNPIVIQENLKFYQTIATYGFSDCMETALRNLLIFTEYNQTNNNFKGSINYFKEFDVQTIASETARTAWADLVSDISQAKYNKRAKVEKSPEGKNLLIMENAKDNNSNKPWVRPAESDGWYYYELEPGLDTIIFVVNKTYNLQLQDFGAFLKHFNLECPSQKVIKTEFLGVTLEETICTITNQDKRNCVLHYHPGHAYFEEYPRGKLIEAMSNFVSQVFPFWTGSYFLPVLNLYRVNFQTIPLTESFKEELLKSILFRHAFLIQQLSSNEAKQYIINFIMKVLPQDAWYKHFMMQSIDQLLSLRDQNTTNNTLIICAKYAAKWDMVPECIKKMQENSEILNSDQMADLIKIFAQNITPQYKKILNNFILEQYDTENIRAQFELVTMAQDIDSELYKILFSRFLSEKNINNPQASFLVAVLLITQGQGAGVTKKDAQDIINKLLPHTEQLGAKHAYRIINDTIRKSHYLGTELSKEIILKFFPKLQLWHWIEIYKDLNVDKELWGQDFIDQLKLLMK